MIDDLYLKFVRTNNLTELERETLEITINHVREFIKTMINSFTGRIGNLNKDLHSLKSEMHVLQTKVDEENEHHRRDFNSVEKEYLSRDDEQSHSYNLLQRKHFKMLIFIEQQRFYSRNTRFISKFNQYISEWFKCYV